MRERLSLSHRNGAVGPERRWNRTVATRNSILFHWKSGSSYKPFRPAGFECNFIDGFDFQGFMLRTYIVGGFCFSSISERGREDG